MSCRFVTMHPSRSRLGRGHAVCRPSLWPSSLPGASPVWLGVLAALAAVSPTTGLAQSSNPAASTVVVTATRTPVRVDQALSEVTVLDRADLEAAGGRTLAELLARQPGIVMWANGGLGTPSAVSMRGLESRHTLLLIDGVRYGSATLGTPTWENLPLEAIERIEIVRGPLSGLYGSDAIGGVVQVFTRRGQAGHHPSASATLGTHGLAELATGLRFGQGALDGQFQLQGVRSTGISATNPNVPFGQYNADRDGWRQGSGQLRLGWQLATGWRLEGSWLEAHGTTHYDDGDGADARARVGTSVQALQLSGVLAPGWDSVLRLARSEDENEVLASASPFSSLGTTGTRQRQLAWEHRVASPIGTVLALVERVRQDVSRPGTPYTVSQRTIDGLALGLNGASGPHSWQASVRRDRNSQFGSPTTGSLAYGLDLAPGLKLTASRGTSFVAPSFNQLYYPGFGNPALLPEEGNSTEVGLRWQGSGIQTRLTWFDQRIRGYISSGPAPTNIPRTRIDGLSLSSDVVLGTWTLAGSVDLLNPVNDTTGSANQGKRLPRRPTETARLSAQWQGQGLTAGATLQAVGPRFDDAANTLRLPGYATLDLRMDGALAPRWRWGLRLNNVLGQRYETTYGYNAPGREALLTLRWAM